MAAAQQQGQGGDNSLAPLWIIALVFIVGLIVWYFFHTQIVSFVFKVKLYEAYAVSFVTSNIDRLIGIIKEVNPAQTSFNEMLAVSTAVGEYIRYPIILILLILAMILYKSDITANFKNIYSMDSLKKLEVGNWPQITPVVNLDLVNQDIDKGPWAMASSPLGFAKKYGLLKIELFKGERLRKGDLEGRYTIKRGEAKRVFTMQLGEYWGGVDALNDHTKALFAIFAAKQNRDRDGVAKLLAQISRSTATGKLDYSGTDALLKKHYNSKSVQRIISRHAYVLTVMASMLEESRLDGILPTSDFIWLKPVDRRLWFMMNNIGRQTAFTEVAGPFAHWIAEKELKRRLLVPMVDEAIKGLEVAIGEIKYVSTDTEED